MTKRKTPFFFTFKGLSNSPIFQYLNFSFHSHFNNHNTSIQFTKEIEGNGKIPFLDCSVTRKNNTLRFTVSRKPTHNLQSYFTQSDYRTNLDEKSTNCLRLTRQFDRRGQSLENFFIRNNHSTDFIECIIYVRLNGSSNN